MTLRMEAWIVAAGFVACAIIGIGIRRLIYKRMIVKFMRDGHITVKAHVYAEREVALPGRDGYDEVVGRVERLIESHAVLWKGSGGRYIAFNRILAIYPMMFVIDINAAQANGFAVRIGMCDMQMQPHMAGCFERWYRNRFKAVLDNFSVELTAADTDGA